MCALNRSRWAMAAFERPSAASSATWGSRPRSPNCDPQLLGGRKHRVRSMERREAGGERAPQGHHAQQGLGRLAMAGKASRPSAPHRGTRARPAAIPARRWGGSATPRARSAGSAGAPWPGHRTPRGPAAGPPRATRPDCPIRGGTSGLRPLRPVPPDPSAAIPRGSNPLRCRARREVSVNRRRPPRARRNHGTNVPCGGPLRASRLLTCSRSHAGEADPLRPEVPDDAVTHQPPVHRRRAARDPRSARRRVGAVPVAHAHQLGQGGQPARGGAGARGGAPLGRRRPPASSLGGASGCR